MKTCANYAHEHHNYNRYTFSLKWKLNFPQVIFFSFFPTFFFRAFSMQRVKDLICTIFCTVFYCAFTSSAEVFFTSLWTRFLPSVTISILKFCSHLPSITEVLSDLHSTLFCFSLFVFVECMFVYDVVVDISKCAMFVLFFSSSVLIYVYIFP